MAVDSTHVYAALAKIRSAKSKAEAMAARNEAKNLGLHAMRDIDKKDRKRFAESLDADIRRAWAKWEAK